MIELIPLNESPFEKYKDVEPIGSMLRDIKARRDALNAKWNILPDEKKAIAYKDILEKVNAVSELIVQRELKEPLTFVIDKSKITPEQLEKILKGENTNG